MSVVTDAGYTAEQWNQLVTAGTVMEHPAFRGKHQLSDPKTWAAQVAMRDVKAPLATQCPDCWGTGLAADYDGSVTGTFNAPFVCWCQTRCLPTSWLHDAPTALSPATCFDRNESGSKPVRPSRGAPMASTRLMPGTKVQLKREGTVVTGHVEPYDPATAGPSFPVSYMWGGNRIWTISGRDECTVVTSTTSHCPSTGAPMVRRSSTGP
jgi:hypothetical protein